jgi:hypothetical protein
MEPETTGNYNRVTALLPGCPKGVVLYWGERVALSVGRGGAIKVLPATPHPRVITTATSRCCVCALRGLSEDLLLRIKTAIKSIHQLVPPFF